MATDDERLLLSSSASRALIAFAARIGQDPQSLAAEAIERFIAEEEPIAERVLQGLEDIKQGRYVSHEELMAELSARIDGAPRKRA